MTTQPKKLFVSGKFESDFFLEMHQFLEYWITSYIIGIDTHLKDCINK